MMKLEIAYKVVEFTRYRIVETTTQDGEHGKSWGFGMGGRYGEFDSKKDAERVRDALERSAEDRARSVL